MFRAFKNHRGQIVVEYVLLLIVLLSLATIIVEATVSRSPGGEGFVVQKWMELIQVISGDYPDTIDGT